MGDSLCLTIKETFFTQEFGLHDGDYSHLIKEGDRLILTKVTRVETQKQKPPMRKRISLELLAKRAM
jgi:hypothetical protein